MKGRYGSILDGRGGRPRRGSLRQHAGHRAMVHLQLRGDRSDRPLLGMVIAQDLRLKLRGNRHAHVLLQPFETSGGGARSLGERNPGSGGHTSSSAIAEASGNRRWMAVPSPPPSPGTANHPAALTVNPDASRFFAGAGNGGRARRERGARAGLPDSARPRCAGPDAALPAHNRRRNRLGRGRNSCRSAPASGSGRTEKIGPAPPVLRSSRTGVDETHDGWNTGPACVPGALWGVALSPAWPLRKSARPPSFQPRLNLRRYAVSALADAPRRRLRLPFRARLSNGGSSPCCAWLRRRFARLTACARKGLRKAGRDAGTGAQPNSGTDFKRSKKDGPA